MACYLKGLGRKRENLFKTRRQLLVSSQVEGPRGSQWNAFSQLIETSVCIFNQLRRHLICSFVIQLFLPSPFYLVLSTSSQQIHHRFNNCLFHNPPEKLPLHINVST